MIEMVERVILDIVSGYWLEKNQHPESSNRFYATWFCDMTLQITLNS
jgi:hypothetical protein